MYHLVIMHQHILPADNTLLLFSYIMTFQKINVSKVVTLLSVGKIEEQVIAGEILSGFT